MIKRNCTNGIVDLCLDGNSSANHFRRQLQAMKIKYFQDTDTLYIEFRAAEITESKDLCQGTVIDLDASGQICAITLEHASQRADIPAFSFEQVAAA